MKKPFVVINSAITADGKISTKERKPLRISSQEDMKRVNELRNNYDAILIGIGTLLADDPTLRGEDLIRVVVDSRGKTPLDSALLKQENLIIASSEEIKKNSKESQLREKADIIICGEKKVDLKKLLIKLKDRGIDRLLVEGGGTINWSFFKKSLVDKLITYVGDFVIGGEQAPTLVDGEGVSKKEKSFRLNLSSVSKLGEGVLIKWDVLDQ